MAHLIVFFQGNELRTVDLVGVPQSVGRAVENTIEVPDPNMSRRHCVIERQNGQWIARDCGSSNGTRVNGQKVLSHVLRDGDKVECGHVALRFVDVPLGLAPASAPPPVQAVTPPSPDGLGGQQGTLPGAPASVPAAPTPAMPMPAAQRPPPPAPHAPTPDPSPGPGIPAPASADSGLGSADSWLDSLAQGVEGSSTPLSTPQVRPRQAAPGQGSSPEQTLRRQRDDLQRLLEINKAINSEQDLRRLLALIIDSAIELMGAERGFLVLNIKGNLRVELARGPGTQVSGEKRDNMVSKSICSQVISDCVPLLTTNAMGDETLGQFASVMDLNLRSIACVPLKIKKRVLGTVYLDNPQQGAFTSDDLELLMAFSEQAALGLDNARLVHELKQKKLMEEELKFAAEIQLKLTPKTIPAVPGVDVIGTMLPAKEVGGDYYDLIKLDDGSLMASIGDVSGKGVAAGLVMATARAAVRTLAMAHQSPLEIVKQLNRLLWRDLDRDLFMSLLVLQYRPATGRVVFTGAGHEHLLIYNARRQSVEARKSGGMVLGLKEDIGPNLNQDAILFQPGDTIALYTDGLTELMNKSGEQYGLERAKANLQLIGEESVKKVMEGLLADAVRFQGRAKQSDDLTLVVLKRT